MSELKSSYDIIIVGAGVGGGALANALAAPGRDILMIERGPRLPRERDNWSVKAVFHDRKYAAKEQWRDREGKPFNPSTYYYVGGNSKFFGAATVRFRKEDFAELQHEAGVAPAWPVSYDVFEPYYARAERLMGTHGEMASTRSSRRAPDPIRIPRSATSRRSLRSSASCAPAASTPFRCRSRSTTTTAAPAPAAAPATASPARSARRATRRSASSIRHSPRAASRW